MRGFIAIPTPGEFKESLVLLQQGLSSTVQGRWVPPQNLHVTLAFLGQMDEDAIRRTMDAMDRTWDPTRLGTITLAPDSLGSFDEWGSATLHLALEKDPALMALQADLARALEDAGFNLPRRRYTPHITLARKAQTTGPMGDLPFPKPTRAESMALFRSYLEPGGAVYKELYSVDL